MTSIYKSIKKRGLCLSIVFVVYSLLTHDGILSSLSFQSTLRETPKTASNIADSGRAVGIYSNREPSKCIAQWETFSPGRPLRATQIVDNTVQPRNQTTLDFFKDRLPNQLFVHPPSNFAFCKIPKNSCSQWSTVLKKVLDDDPTRDGVYYSIGKSSQKKFRNEGRQAEVQQLLQDPTSLRAIFVREPLARFVSAFLNKCFADDCGNPLCLPRKHHQSPKGQILSFRAALEWILDEKTDVSRINNHWSRQSTQCGLDKVDALHSLYNVVGFVDKKTMSGDATCLMEEAGLSRYNTKGDGTGVPFWVRHSEMTIKNRHYRNEDETELLKRMYTPDLARRFIQKFRKDYEMFHMEEPEWVQYATGEWLDSLDHHQCYSSGQITKEELQELKA